MDAQFHAIPAELRSRPQWVIWRCQERDGKPTKIPYQAANPSRKASSTKPATWGTFEQAVAVADQADGIGYVFSAEDPYCGIDLDHCRDVETGAILPEAQAIINTFDTYTEVSQSGTGVHLVLRGKLPADTWHKVKPPELGFEVEVYDHGRYFCMTGAAL